MDKSLSREIDGLKSGISGFYRTKEYKTRLLALILAVALIVGGVVTAVLLERNVWAGRIYIFAYSNSFYTNHFYSSSALDALLDERGLSRAEFEDVTGLTVVQRKYLTDEQIVGLGLDGIIPDAETLRSTKPYGMTRFYCVLVDKDGSCLYQGVDVAALVAALRASGF